jgi:DNA-directed RNA polymerase specialized sigma24 family protein
LLHIIYSRKWIDRLRHKGRELEVRNEEGLRYTSGITDDALIIAEDAMAEQTKQERLARAFGQLSELCRRLLSLLSTGVPPREAAATLQMNSADTVHRRKNACTERWRALFLEL